MGSTGRNIVTLAVAGAVIAGFGTYGAISASTARADSVGPIDFEAPTYTVGTINGQNGWTSGAARDQGVRHGIGRLVGQPDRRVRADERRRPHVLGPRVEFGRQRAAV